ncbi:MAG: SPFH domain-containing protein, partial [Bacteroidota bacterium]
MKKATQFLAVFALGTVVLSSCMVVNPGEVAVKQRFGQLSDEVYNEGLVFYNPISTQIITTPTRTVNMEVNLSLPSKEGLNIKSQISI